MPDAVAWGLVIIAGVAGGCAVFGILLSAVMAPVLFFLRPFFGPYLGEK
jgi:hypothetical protein